MAQLLSHCGFISQFHAAQNPDTMEPVLEKVPISAGCADPFPQNRNVRLSCSQLPRVPGAGPCTQQVFNKLMLHQC